MVRRKETQVKAHKWRLTSLGEDRQVRHRCIRCGMISTWTGGRDWCIGWEKPVDRKAKAQRELRRQMPWL